MLPDVLCYAESYGAQSVQQFSRLLPLPFLPLYTYDVTRKLGDEEAM
jgi:hypothetical protein